MVLETNEKCRRLKLSRSTILEIISSIHGSFPGSSATKIFLLIDEYQFIFFSPLQSLKYTSIKGNRDKIEVADHKVEKAPQYYESVC